MLDTVKINHVQHISFTQSRLTDAVSVILSELLSYEHPSNLPGILKMERISGTCEKRFQRGECVLRICAVRSEGDVRARPDG